jgi:hypothetical protein
MGLGGLANVMYPNLLKRYFRDLSRRKEEAKVIRDWIARGKPPRPPHAVKASVVKDYARKYSVPTLVETGTYLGDMVESCKTSFRRIISIELSRDLHARATQRFATDKHVSVLQGDSGEVLASVLARLDGRCVFWLDAHYSGGVTAQGNVLTPVYAELDCIFAHHVRDHIVLVDDAGDFVGTEGYPTVAELQKFVAQRRPDTEFEVRDDIIRILT